MARAKRTDRADARRRFRQAQDLEVDDSVQGAEPAPARQAGPPERPGIMAAFRAAYRPANIREDLRALPELLRARSFLASLALVVGGFAASAIAPTNEITRLVLSAVVIPPAMMPIFVVGFFARRASYLLGLIIAIVDVVLYSAYVYAIAPTIPSTTPVTPAQIQEVIVSAITIGPPSGLFFAAAAAWYRRFLTLSNAGARQRAEARRRQQHQEQRRRARATR